MGLGKDHGPTVHLEGESAPSSKKTGKGPEDELALIRKKLGHYTADVPVAYWLNTGSKRLNAVLGSEKLGIPYGKIIELFGWESTGKTLLAILLTGLAQADGAEAVWLDFERAFDKEWATRQGVDVARMRLFQVLIGRHGTEKNARLDTAQEVWQEAEAWMAMWHNKHPHSKLIVVVDSVAAMLPEDEAVAGLVDSNMKSHNALAVMMSPLMKRMTGLAAVYNATFIFLNQLREGPVRFGDPSKPTGGNSLKFYASIRARVKRVKKGRLMSKGKIVGLKGMITNIKNRAGGGSVEGHVCGFKAYYNKYDWLFLSEQSIREEDGDGGNE